MKKILLVDDFCGHMINGVTTVINKTSEKLRGKGYSVYILYPEILRDQNIVDISQQLDFINEKVLEADYIHILTEAPLGKMVQDSCLKYNRKFTTSMYTKFPEYIEEKQKYNGVAVGALKAEHQELMRNFHQKSSRVLVPTNAMVKYAESIGIPKSFVWTIGVDTDIFKPEPDHVKDPDSISCIYYGRVTIEKNIDAFLDINDPRIKKTIAGPKMDNFYTRKYLESQGIKVLGKLTPQEAARELPKHDVLVFPSHTDTFGLVMLEAMACGVPVAAFPNAIIGEVIENGVTGIMDTSLIDAIYRANKLNRLDCVKRAGKFSWDSATDQFIGYLIEAK